MKRKSLANIGVNSESKKTNQAQQPLIIQVGGFFVSSKGTSNDLIIQPGDLHAKRGEGLL
jgi:hypothetical protein